jgi:FtsP/CotA-like multicopper oxidase with cupredoxin domain
VAGDIVPPTAAAPSAALRSAATMSTGNVPVRVSWSGADTGGSGLGTYDLARSIDGGAFTTIASRLTSTSYDTTTSRTHTYRFEARAHDWAGNLGAWKAAATVKINVLQESSTSIHYSGTWKAAGNASYSGGGLRAATTSGASASYTFTGRSVAWVSSRGSTRGSAKVYIDGVLAATVNLNAATLSYRYVAYQKTWTASGKHTIKIVALGTSGHPRVDLDAIETVTNP